MLRHLARLTTLISLPAARGALAASLLTVSLQAQPETAFVARDGFGVAHISGISDAGAFYAAGYAHAEDRLFQICLHRVIAQGRVSEFFGPDMDPGDGLHLELDRYVARLGWRRHAAREANMLPPSERALLDAFAQGITDYMVKVRADSSLEHPLFAQTGIPLNEDWVASDSLLLWLRLASNFRKIDWNEAANRFEIDQLLQTMTPTQILDAEFSGLCDDDSAVVQQADVDPALLTQMGSYATAKGLNTDTNCRSGIVPPPPHFSHAWAVGSHRVVEGVAALVSDPRLGLSVPNTLYEWHMRGATFDVRGAGAPGVPYFLVGSNPNVAWGATALGPDQADLFKMEANLTPPSPTFTLDLDDGLGPQQIPLLTRRVEIKVLGQPSEWVTYRETDFGPLVTPYVELASGQTLGAQEEYALKALPWSHPELSNLHGYLEMYRATNVTSFRDALEGQLFPAINTVFADSAGSIGFQANGGFPVRANGAFLAGYLALDGTTVLNDWQELLPNDFKPWVIDPAAGAIWSANHQPIGSFYPLPFVSGVLGTNTRAWRLRQLLDTGAPMTAADVYAVHLSAIKPDAKALTEVAEAIEAVDTAFPYSVQAQNALAELKGWLASGAEMTNVDDATFLAGSVTDRFTAVGGMPQSPLAAVYGGRGLIPLLKVLLAKTGDPAGFSPTADEKQAIDNFLHQAWLNVTAAVQPGTKGGAGSANPAVWQPLYQQKFLTDVYSEVQGLGLAPWHTAESVPKLAGLGGTKQQGVAIRAYDNTVPFVHDPPRATHGGTIMEQAGQSYTQFVLPGVLNASTSQLTPGVREWALNDPMFAVPVDASGHPETDGLPIDINQEQLWSAIGNPAVTVDVKFSPTTLDGINTLTGGLLSIETLTYVP